MSTMKQQAMSLMVVLFAACGSESLVPADSFDNDPSRHTSYVLPVPYVEVLSPSNFAAGDTVTIFGTGFVPQRYGQTTLHLRGTFTTSAGEQQSVDMLQPVTYVNPGRAQFVFEPAAPPTGFGTALGAYSGYVWAVNEGLDGTINAQQAEPLMQSVGIDPSIAASSISPEGEGCSEKRLSATTEGTKLSFDLELIGLEPASVLKPVTIETAYVRLAEADLPIIPGTETDQIQTASYTLTYGSVLSLTGIDFGALPDTRLQGEGTLSVKATDGNGKSIQRSFTITFHRQQYVDYDGSIELAEIYEPVLVSGCLPGGEYGRSVSYNEGSGESRSRSVAYSGGASLSLKILNLSFGINVGDSVSSSTSESLSMSGHILPMQYGVFYRQTQRLLRRGNVMQVNSCGVKNTIGEALVTDWTWAPDLAITHNGICPPAPDSNLPAAKVYIY